ncbi:MAG: anti-sigma factor [Chloroflexota bacterium]|nr:anti-sigma factor [Chloroflexota bacterium]
MSAALRCDQADELGAAFVLGALDTNEALAVQDHLATCVQPHAELRAMLGADQVLALSQEPVAPSAALRDRLMATVARTSQEHETEAQAAPVVDLPARRGWFDWLSPRVARPLAVAAVVAALAFGAWNVSLQSQLGQRDRALRSVAAAIAGGGPAFRVDGSAGQGYVVDTPGNGAALVVAGLTSLPAGRIYELWLIDASGKPVAVGTFTPSDSTVAVAPVDRDLTGFVTFAVTVERQRVAAPTSTPVMAGKLKAS